MSAYGAVAYRDWKTDDGIFVSSIIANKNRIVPCLRSSVVFVHTNPENKNNLSHFLEESGTMSKSTSRVSGGWVMP